MRYATILLFVVAAACARQTTPIVMKHPETGKIVQCGPYPASGIGSIGTPDREAQCIRDYKGQGYVRQ